MMTEMETLQRAKLYMEKLANGINPLDGTIIPDGEVVNNVRLSRCFFYVADVLGQVIDNGGVVPQKPHRAPFDLSAVQRENIELSDAPIPVSDLAKRINAGIDASGMRRLSFNTITKWLLSIGVLEEYPTGEGKTAKRPTAQGRELGIIMEERISQEGRPYAAVLYSRGAQQFIVDNLDAMQPYMKHSAENKGQPWSREQDERLAELYRNGVSVNEIAMALKRNSSGVRARLKKLGLME